ncbi:MAG: metal-dependent hydrolase [Candidatus Pacearchaeota archaeon]|nr:MAG: metal-dependent hydrolase [Candidatus Pacearchaeota archaeon]
MMFRTHILFALFFYLLFITIFPIQFSIIFTLVLCFGAILPDIDSPRSYVNRNYLLGFGRGVAAFSKHRGFWHSIYGLLIFFVISFVIVYFINAPLIFSIALPIGYFMHLAADSLNISGIKWLWKSKTFHLKWKISTGTISEQIFFIILLLFTLYLIIGNQGIQEITAFVTKIKP